MEVNVNFIFFQDLKDRSEDAGDVLRIVIVREGKNPEAALDDSSSDFFPLQLE